MYEGARRYFDKIQELNSIGIAQDESVTHCLNMLARNLKHHRLAKSDSLEDVAELTGITKSLLSKYERGVVVPGLEAILKLTRYYKISFDQLIS